jgi:hypothetical protein
MDVLYVWLRQPAEVVCVEPEDGIAIRFDANTDEWVGYTIVDCRRRFAGQSPARITLPIVPPFALEPLRRVLATGEKAAGRELQLV